jgi:hypothetical protein
LSALLRPFSPHGLPWSNLADASTLTSIQESRKRDNRRNQLQQFHWWMVLARVFKWHIVCPFCSFIRFSIWHPHQLLDVNSIYLWIEPNSTQKNETNDCSKSQSIFNMPKRAASTAAKASPAKKAKSSASSQGKLKK